MKVLFGVNLTYDEKNEKEDGSEFIIRRVPESMFDDYEPEENETVTKEDKIKEWKVRFFNIVAVCVLGVGALGILTPFDDENLSFSSVIDIISKNPIWFSVSAVIAILGVFLVVKGNRMEKAHFEINEQDAEEKIDEFDRKCYEYLGVPEDADTFEIFGMCYKIINNEIVFEHNSAIGFSNPEMKVYRKGDCLCFADIENLYEIKPDSEGRIEKHSGEISVLSWHKEEKYNKGAYQKYNIRRKGLLKYVMHTYYSYDFTVNGEEYKMYFPPYEFENVMKITGAATDTI